MTNNYWCTFCFIGLMVISLVSCDHHKESVKRQCFQEEIIGKPYQLNINKRKIVDTLIWSNIGFDTIPDVSKFRHLKYLDLSSNHIKSFHSLDLLTRDSLHNLIPSQLQYLDLSDNEITGSFIIQLFRFFPELRYLNVSNNSIENFSFLGYTKEPMEYVNCSNNDLKSLFLNDKINYLNISNNPNLSHVFHFDINKINKVNRVGIKSDLALEYQKQITIRIE